MQFFQRLFCGTALSLGALACCGSAAAVYNNGAPDHVSGNEMTQWIQTEDFTLTSSETIGAVKFWDFQNSNSYNGSISWFVYADNSGLPGSVLDEGNVAATRTRTGKMVLGSYTEYVNNFSTGNITLGPGTYHLGLHNGMLSDPARAEFYWETTYANGTPSGIEMNLENGNTWNYNGQEHAFELLGTAATAPEPGSLLLLGLGGIALGGFRKLRRS